MKQRQQELVEAVTEAVAKKFGATNAVFPASVDVRGVVEFVLHKAEMGRRKPKRRLGFLSILRPPRRRPHRELFPNS